MQTQNSSGNKAFLTNATQINEGMRVKIISQGADYIVVDIAAAADKAIGVATSTVAPGLPITIKLFSASGTWLMVTSAAIAIGTQVYPTANGCIAGAGTTPLPLVTLEASTAAGDIIEVGEMFVGA
jgi:hypothetical protein